MPPLVAVGIAVTALAAPPFMHSASAQTAAAQTASVTEELRAGRMALEGARFDQALAAFERALAAQPDSRQAALGRAIALDRLDRSTEAEIALSALLAAAPDDMNARFYRGVARYRLGDLPAAIEDLRAAEAAGAPLAVVPLRLGDALYAAGEAQAAHDAYARAAAMPSPPAAVFRGLGNALYAMEDYRGAERAYSEALQGDPADGHAALYRGWTRERLGRFDGALSDYDRAVEILGGASAEPFIARGDLLRGAGANAAAAGDYEAALALEPENVGALYGAALSLLDQGAITAAAPLSARLLTLTADDPTIEATALSLRGKLRLLGGDPRGAEADYTAALERTPEDANAHFNRGLARARLRDVAGALADYREAARLAPTLATAQYAHARAAVAAGRAEEAIAAAEQADTLWGADPLAARERGRTLLALDRPFAALTVIDDFLEDRPRDSEALQLKAMAMTRLGRNAEALAFAEALTDAEPNSPVGHLLEAEARIALAEPEAAREALERATRLGADPATVLRLSGGAWLTEARLTGDTPDRPALEQAARALDQAISLSESGTEGPDAATAALALRAAARERMGDLDGARRDLDRVIATRPQDPEMRFARAGVLKELGECEAAVKDYDAGLSVRPDNAQARAARADCRFQLGRFMGGLADWIGSLL